MKTGNSYLAVFIIAIASPTNTLAGPTYETSYSYVEDNVTLFSKAPDPTNHTETHTMSIGFASFNVQAIPTSPLELKASAGFEIDIDQTRDGTAEVQLVTATAQAKTFLLETAFVEGITGVPGGTVEITWAVTGTSDIEVNTPGALIVRDASTSAVVTADAQFWTNQPTPFVHDEADDLFLPPGNPIDAHEVYSTGFLQSYVTDWSANTGIDLSFGLEVTSNLDTELADTSGYVATVNGNFGNTATLHAVNIFDGNGMLLSNAYLNIPASNLIFAPTAVPEPSMTLLWATLSSFVILLRYRRR